MNGRTTDRLELPREGPAIHPGLFRRMAAGTLLLALFFLSGPALEAQGPTPLAEGARSLSFGIDGDGSGEAGIWIFISDQTNLGLLGTLDWISENREPPRSDRTQRTIAIGPRVKWYIPGPARVAPFWFGGLSFLHSSRTEDGASDRSSRGVGLDGGFGVDWFPVDQISVGGWTGLRFSSARAENDDTTTRLRTFTTGLRVHLYF